MNDSNGAAGLARGWIIAWQTIDLAWLRDHLTRDFVHTSPFGRLEGRDHYLETVEPMARKSVARLEIIDVIADRNDAVIWFENTTPSGVVPTCDWIKTKAGSISEIRSFYDTAAVRKVLSPDEQQRLDEG